MNGYIIGRGSLEKYYSFVSTKNNTFLCHGTNCDLPLNHFCPFLKYGTKVTFDLTGSGERPTATNVRLVDPVSFDENETSQVIMFNGTFGFAERIPRLCRIYFHSRDIVKDDGLDLGSMIQHTTSSQSGKTYAREIICISE